MNRFLRKALQECLFLSSCLIILPLCLPAASAQSPAENSYQIMKKSYERLKSSPGKQEYRDQWEEVINGFVRIADRFPDSNRADDSLYNAGMFRLDLRKISRASRDTEAALTIFARLSRDYPESRYADDAQYMIGEIYRTIKNDPEEAYRAYALVSERFPGGDMAAKAGERLSELPVPPPPAMTRPRQVDANGSGAKILGIRHWAGNDYVRVVIDLDRPAAFEQHRLSSPDRIYVDMQGARLSAELEKTPIPVSAGYLKKIRIGQFSQDTARVVLDFEKIRNVSIFSLSEPDRIVMDVAGEESTVERFLRLRTKLKGQGGTSLTLSEQLGMKVAKVVIDAGHGGKDPGCIGKSGLKEKDITLDLARRLKKLLEERLNMEVVMTRNRDVFVPLDERAAIANREEADLFISIHVNAAENPSLRGVETWFLDLAASERAQKIAARENFYSEKPMSDLAVTLNDLLLSNKTQESSRLAETLNETLTRNLRERFKGVENLGVKGAPFVVLVGARMPSVLTEVSFLSNPTEERRLKSDRYRDHIAEGLLRGVRNYVNTSEYASRN